MIENKGCSLIFRIDYMLLYEKLLKYIFKKGETTYDIINNFCGYFASNGDSITTTCIIRW